MEEKITWIKELFIKCTERELMQITITENKCSNNFYTEFIICKWGYYNESQINSAYVDYE